MTTPRKWNNGVDSRSVLPPVMTIFATVVLSTPSGSLADCHSIIIVFRSTSIRYPDRMDVRGT